MVRVGTARQRLVERLSASANLSITLLIAPAGYGKSVALRQYLQQCTEPRIHFGLRPEHGTLLGFLRGFAEAARPVAPHAITTLAGAYERNQASPKRAADLAQWMQVHLESFEGVIAIDDLHVADNDEDIGRFLASLIDSSKDRVRWIIASRSTANLPVASWVTYRDADLPIGERDLQLTLEEARTAAIEFESTIGDEELRDLLELTEGWPAAMSFALRTSTRSSDLRNVSAVTREMIYRFLAEQVCETLDEEERALLEVAITLPEIDVDVLERAGFDRALQIVERLRERTAFVHEERPGVYHCHDLFRDFLRHQNALTGKRAQQSAHERAGRALEGGGDIEHAITAYVAAGARSDVVRLLERHGFDLLERARGDLVSNAIEALDETTRRENAAVLALLGALQATAGKFTRAESLFRRALARAGENKDLVAIASLRLAVMMANEGRDVSEVTGILTDGKYNADVTAEALSLMAASSALLGDIEKSLTLVEAAEKLLAAVEEDSTRAKVLHRLGIARRHVGHPQYAVRMLKQSDELARALSLFGLSSRVNAALSNVALHEFDDLHQQFRFAQIAAAQAEKAGDALVARTSHMQMLSAMTRGGRTEECLAIEKRLESMQPDELTLHYLAFFRAVRAAWDGEFPRASELMGSCWRDLRLDFDRVSAGAQLALFLAVGGKMESSKDVAQTVTRLIRELDVTSIFRKRYLAVSCGYLALAEKVNGRSSVARRLAHTIASDDQVTQAVANIVKAIVDDRQATKKTCEPPQAMLEALVALDYPDAARIFRAAVLKNSTVVGDSVNATRLTPAEVKVLKALADGLVPKEIAADIGRSVHTVRAHIASAIWKLKCHGRADAVRLARRLGII